MIGPLLVIVGETASGKSELAIRLAQEFDGEIIAADSWTVRREADIGTAKPSKEEQALVPHHLLNVAGPDEDFTAAVFKEMALKAIEDISDRGKLPIMVGGTGLYIDGVLYDYGFLPAGDRGEREELNKLSVEELEGRIKQMGLDFGDVDRRNKRRLIRLIETAGAKPERKPLRENTLILGIQSGRETLESRIIQRTDAMIAAGLEDEVRGLAERYGWQAEALKGVGYAQWKGCFEGAETRQEARQKIIKATLDLAKRQRTWFKRNKSIQWFSAPVNWPDVVERVTTLLIR
jgi:tRNA dimethylallyltransferase